MKNIISGSFRESSHLVKEKLFLFIIIFFLQIIFFSAMFYITYIYQTRALEAGQEVMTYLEKNPVDDYAVASGLVTQKELLGDDPALIHRKYIEIINALFNMLIFSFLGFALINGFIWNLTDSMFRKKRLKDYLSYQLKFFLAALFYFSLMLLFLYALFRLSLLDALASLQGPNTNSMLLGIFIAIMSYFAFISFSLIGFVKFKGILKKTFSVGIRKFPGIIMCYLCNLAVLAAVSTFLYFSTELHISLLIFFSLALFIALVCCRVFLMESVKRLT